MNPIVVERQFTKVVRRTWEATLVLGESAGRIARAFVDIPPNAAIVNIVDDGDASVQLTFEVEEVEK